MRIINAKMKMTSVTRQASRVMLTLITLWQLLIVSLAQQQQQVNNANFPGVSREIASFCAARPSLQIDLASMIVHVKRNVSFNYKLYLFSADDVFQTGQVIPRDDFRIHSFPVKLKKLNEFWPASVSTYQSLSHIVNASSSITNRSFIEVSSDSFKLKHFMRPVSLNPAVSAAMKRRSKTRRPRTFNQGGLSRPSDARGADLSLALSPGLPDDARGDILPGDDENFNKHIQFDRDDQLSSISRRATYFNKNDYLAAVEEGESAPDGTDDFEINREGTNSANGRNFSGDHIIPVGSFSSFNVNTTYLVRKDFNQQEMELIKLEIDAAQFLVKKVFLIYPELQSSSGEFDFLNHKLLKDPNTRITSINQIYEDWITRNFYTIVYIQRRLNQEPASSDDEVASDETGGDRELIVQDRLIFRGTSIALLGADQLDYIVKAAAFITEKNGLHYYLEFLNTGKFYLCAIDWTKRPFKIIDSRKFPIKTTKTLLDNEELLLCPPAICYSNQPLDEVVSYGRLALSRKAQREASILSSSFAFQPGAAKLSTGAKVDPQNVVIVGFKSMQNETSLTYLANEPPLNAPREARELKQQEAGGPQAMAMTSDQNISLDDVIEEVRLAASQLQTRLHLRDWVWILPRNNKQQPQQDRAKQVQAAGDNSETTTKASQLKLSTFDWRYELARRNDIKVKQDTYGYVLTGHEIDASYRIYNELYLISVIISIGARGGSLTFLSFGQVARA